MDAMLQLYDDPETLIIDKSIVWYGSVCVLGYSSDDDNIIKIEDNKLAVEMLDVINC